MDEDQREIRNRRISPNSIGSWISCTPGSFSWV